MLKKKHYLKDIGMMKSEEVERYWISVRRWTCENYPRLCSLVDAWTDTDIKDFDEGLRLVSALRSARPYVGAAYAMDVKQRLKVMRDFLSEIDQYIRRNASELHVIVDESSDGTVDFVSGEAVRKANTPEKRRIKKFVARVSRPNRTDENGVETAPEPSPVPEVDGRRPQHLSQYIHVLPDNLQKEAQNLEGWYLLLADYHSHLHLLVENPDSSKHDREYYAGLVAVTEQKILNFWHRVDIAWDEHNGKRVDSKLKQSLAKEARNLATTGKLKGDSEYSREEIEAMEDGDEKERIKAARMQRDKHFIVRCSMETKPKSRDKVRAAIQELHDWGFILTEKMQEVALGYGFDDIPKDWFRMTAAEKAELERQRMEEEQRLLDEQRRANEEAMRQEEIKRQLEAEAAEAKRVSDREARRQAIRDLFDNGGVSINS